jgi:hypothetical protein
MCRPWGILLKRDRNEVCINPKENKAGNMLGSSAHLPSVLYLLRQRRVAAGNGLGTGLGTKAKYVRPKLRPTTPPRRGYIAAMATLPLC